MDYEPDHALKFTAHPTVVYLWEVQNNRDAEMLDAYEYYLSLQKQGEIKRKFQADQLCITTQTDESYAKFLKKKIEEKRLDGNFLFTDLTMEQWF